MRKCIFILLISIPVLVRAQEQSGFVPTLNGHMFTPVSGDTDPFTNTRLSTIIGVGSTVNYSFPDVIIDEDTIQGFTGEILFANLGINYRQHVRDWVSFGLKAGLAARLGTDVQSILTSGLSTVISFELQTKFRLMKTEKVQMSSVIKVSNYEGTFIDIRGFVNDIINGNSNPSVSQKVPSLSAGVGIQFAWGITKWLGFRTTLELGYGEALNRGDTDLFYSAGVTLDGNLNFIKVPVGLAFNYTISNDPFLVFNDTDYGNLYVVKLSYTGSKDFVFGLEFADLTLPNDFDENYKAVNTALVLTYYFN